MNIKGYSLKGSKGTPKEASPGQKSRISGGSRQNKSSVNIVKGKRTPKKNKHGQNSLLKGNVTKGDSEEKTDRLKSKSNVQQTISEDSEEEHTEMVDENLTDREASEKEITLGSQGRYSEDKKGSPNHPEESDEVKSTADGNLSEDVDNLSGNDQKGNNEEEKSHSVEKAVDESNEDSRADACKATESEPKQIQECDNAESRSPVLKKCQTSLPSDAVDSGISDDEPLSKWKLKGGKSSSKQGH